MTPAPILTNTEGAIIARWAEQKRQRLRAVLVFGSRFTGVRRYKENPKSIPDLDLAASIDGVDQDDRQEYFIRCREIWSSELSDLLGGLPVEFYSADSDLTPLVSGFLIDRPSKLLWHDQERWSRMMVFG